MQVSKASVQKIPDRKLSGTMYAMKLLTFRRMDDSQNDRGANHIGKELRNEIDSDHTGDDKQKGIASAALLSKGFPEEQSAANQE